MQLQWRHNNGYDAILRVDDDGNVVDWCDAARNLAGPDMTALAMMLTRPKEIDSWSLNPLSDADRPDGCRPNHWGKLVLSREPDDKEAHIPYPVLFAQRLAHYFRCTA
jgi:hypothetical protein